MGKREFQERGLVADAGGCSGPHVLPDQQHAGHIGGGDFGTGTLAAADKFTTMFLAHTCSLNTHAIFSQRTCTFSVAFSSA